jgi:hypothetical protein
MQEVLTVNRALLQLKLPRTANPSVSLLVRAGNGVIEPIV